VSPFRLALLNPNTEPRHTEEMSAVASDALEGVGEVTPITAARGPRSIESAADSAVAAAEVLAMVKANAGFDAYLISCFGDPGLAAARELLDGPVVGIGEAAYTAASLVASRFAVLTTLARGVPEIEDVVRSRGLEPRCVAVLPLAVPVSAQGAGNPDAVAAILASGRHAVDELGAEALVLACGAMASVAREVSDTLRVPVCDGVAFGALLAHALWRSGLATSKVGAYARPEPIPYVGMPALESV